MFRRLGYYSSSGNIRPVVRGHYHNSIDNLHSRYIAGVRNHHHDPGNGYDCRGGYDGHPGNNPNSSHRSNLSQHERIGDSRNGCFKYNWHGYVPLAG